MNDEDNHWFRRIRPIRKAINDAMRDGVNTRAATWLTEADAELEIMEQELREMDSGDLMMREAEAIETAALVDSLKAEVKASHKDIDGLRAELGRLRVEVEAKTAAETALRQTIKDLEREKESLAEMIEMDTAGEFGAW